VRKSVTENLSVEPLGTLLEIQVTGPDPIGVARARRVRVETGAWVATEILPVALSCTLNLDSAMDLRDEITAWLRSLNAEG
jgi:hypothetical protein